MSWLRFAAVVISAGLVSSLTDWFFAGDWIHRHFTYPEVWRKGNETRAIVLTSPLPFLTCGAFAWLAIRLGMRSLPSTLELAFAIWIIGPLPLILANGAFIKLHRVFVVCYASGWLVKLSVAALAVAFILR